MRPAWITTQIFVLPTTMHDPRPCFSSPPLVSLSFQINHYTHPLHPNLQSCLKSICQLLSAVTSMPVSSFVVVVGFWWLARCCGLGPYRIRRRRCDRIGAGWPWISATISWKQPRLWEDHATIPMVEAAKRAAPTFLGLDRLMSRKPTHHYFSALQHPNNFCPLTYRKVHHLWSLDLQAGRNLPAWDGQASGHGRREGKVFFRFRLLPRHL